ncbi:cupin domain-containing protein [Longimicrobium sp.]|uniref:cupin domain-containing protein n=1 Tax=Longimicrobium sp. TaxID=2029185 RepID=UPI002E35EEA1|nr:cupin domain-containing protein [Longimicrobium sp.]HEX6041074.1 cupin domain-containing protein [Longimicrobium sp.]
MPSTIDTAPHASRRIWNPIQKDAAIFLVTAEESGGAHTLLEIELAPGGGNTLHTHTDFAEHFEVIEGELVVQVGSQEHVLGPGGAAVAPPRTPHRFQSRSARPTRFRVALRPGHAGFERALRIGYGMAEDGRVNARGLPRRLDHLALLVDMSGTVPAGVAALALPLLRFIAARARRRGVEAELTARYCPPMAPAEPHVAGAA